MDDPVSAFFPVLALAAIVVGGGLGMLLISHLLGPRRRTKQKFLPYECGVEQLDDSRKQVSVKFYLVATLFILFDIETVFLIPWAYVYREQYPVLGAALFVEMAVFVGLLVVGYVYLWRRGALEWD
ncbi:MAG: NADH-quinone oxidoreductase subunit A [Planctomycetes bacterium]|nr:NADH-quinone oxidoreductase subunit A [Planctomycetota bacterium]